MTDNWNALQWDGAPGHYEVYYLSLTDRESGWGFWIRYTMVAPLPRTGSEATCALWFMAMDPTGNADVIGRKRTLPISELVAQNDPFELRIGDARLTDHGMSGSFDDVSWDLTWTASLHAYEHVHPLLRRAKLAKTVLVLPHPDLEVSGKVADAGGELVLDGARGGQAHLWGSKHANRWAWIHCNDFETLEGEPRPGTFVDGVSVFVPRFGREVGPSTPVVGRFNGQDFMSTSPLRVLSNSSRFGLTSWHLEARDGRRRIVVDVDADRDAMAGVTYHDPDGDKAYCYNSETASARLHVWDYASRSEGWKLVETLVAPRCAHFEYAQRDQLADMPLHVT
jgi:hypothetical protein